MTEEMKNVTPETAEAPEHVETMEDYKEELEASFKQIHEGDILTGTVIGVSESAITLDLKYYTDGIIRLEDFTNDPNFNLAEDIHVGDEISATVIRRDDGEGHILLSAKEANEVLAWDKLRKYKEEGTNLKVKIAGIVKSGVLPELAGDVVFFGVPAEEYIEIAYRKKLVESGKLHFMSGKGELIYEGAFDDIDMAMQMHADKNMPKPTVSIGESSNGFVGKTVRYIGKTAHAADAPHEGVNALNAACLGLMGINALRETFREQDVVRVHPIITKGGDFVNSVPDDVRLELYVRAKTMDAIDSTHTRVDAALKAGGDAVGAQTVIETLPGMFPLSCNKRMNELFAANAKIAYPDVEIKDAGHFSASTDMGDVSHLMPVIHPFIGGTDGLLHTPDFHMVDFNAAVLLPAKAFAMMLIDLLYDDAKEAKAILAEFKPILTKEEYIAKLESYFNK